MPFPFDLYGFPPSNRLWHSRLWTTKGMATPIVNQSNGAVLVAPTSADGLNPDMFTIELQGATPAAANASIEVGEGFRNNQTAPPLGNVVDAYRPALGGVPNTGAWNVPTVVDCLMSITTGNPVAPTPEMSIGIELGFDGDILVPASSTTPFIKLYAANFDAGTFLLQWRLSTARGDGSAVRTVVIPTSKARIPHTLNAAHLRIVYVPGEFASAWVEGVEGAVINDPAALPPAQVVAGSVITGAHAFLHVGTGANAFISGQFADGLVTRLRGPRGAVPVSFA